MDRRLEEIKVILKKYGQEHLLNQYENLDDVHKKILVEQIEAIDFELMQSLYQSTKKEKKHGEDKITPMEYLDKYKLNEKYKYYENIGKKAIREGKLAAVTMAGGQGTRLGHSGPKGTYDIGLASHKSIFEILCDNLKQAKEKYHVDIPWYLMTSDENNADTIAFFEKNQYFGYPKSAVQFFIQGKLPMIDTNGKILLDENGMMKQAADGHGGVFEAMRRNGVLYNMKEKGIEYYSIGR